LPQAKAFFAEMAQRYGKYPNVIYEPFNEPLQNVTWSKDIKPYHAAIIQTIRQYDPDNLVICGTRVWSQRVDEAADDPLPYSNVAYTLHYYAASHKQWLRDTAQKALDKGVAIMVTEFGTSEASGNGVLDQVETRKWFDFMEANSISWCNWSVADKDETSAALRPGAPANGGWTDAQISPSGLLIRAEMRAKNSVKTPFAPVVQPVTIKPTTAAPTKPAAAKPVVAKPVAKVQPKPTTTRRSAP
jgi:endoglucanase